MEFKIPDRVSTIRGSGFPPWGLSVTPLVTKAPKDRNTLFFSFNLSISLLVPDVPEAVIRGVFMRIFPMEGTIENPPDAGIINDLDKENFLISDYLEWSDIERSVQLFSNLMSIVKDERIQIKKFRND